MLWGDAVVVFQFIDAGEILRAEIVNSGGVLKWRWLYTEEVGQSAGNSSINIVLGQKYKVFMRFKQATNASSDDGEVFISIDGVPILDLNTVDNFDNAPTRVRLSMLGDQAGTSGKVIHDNVKVGVGPVSGWTNSSAGSGELTWNPNGSVDFFTPLGGGGESASMRQRFSNLTIGKTYRLVIDVGSVTVTAALIRGGNTNWFDADIIDTTLAVGTTGEQVFTFVPTSTDPEILIGTFNVIDATLNIKSFSIQRAGGIPKEVIVDPSLTYRGRMDVMEDKIEGDKASISISSVNRLQDLENVNGRKFTAEDQKIDFPGDKALDGMTLIVDKKIQWK